MRWWRITMMSRGTPPNNPALSQRSSAATAPAAGAGAGMVLPLLLIFLAFFPAAIVAYGTDPRWAGLAHGLGFILLTRRLQWPLVALSVLLCVALLVLIISGRRRGWWLIGLMPVLALFVYRFSTGAINQWAIAEEPALISADRAPGIGDSDHVVGLEFEGNAYAYPYANLYATPAVVQSDYDKRFLLMWSPFADRAVASMIDRELRVRELEIVSMPANALLLYNTRLGQFINGVTGQTTDDQKPAGFRNPIPTTRTTWGRWRKDHPQTRVMVAVPGKGAGPRQPLPPRYPMAGVSKKDADAKVALVLASPAHPLAIAAGQVRAGEPWNLLAGDMPVLLYRDPGSGSLRAFDRRIEGDLVPRFKPNPNPKRAGVALVDSDTDVGWSSTGVAVDGDKARQGKRLTPIPVEDDLNWGVIRFWYPHAELIAVKPAS